MSKGLKFIANNAVGFLALFIALGGVGYAASGGFTSGGTVRACANEEGAIRLLKAGKKCKRGLTAVSWSQSGPAGASGATGATGATGAAGATGAQGQPGTSLWARVDANGSLLGGNGFKSAKLNAGPFYEVKFDRDITHCGIVATQNSGPSSLQIAYAASEEVDTVVVVIIKTGSPAETFKAEFSVAVYC